MTVVTDPVVIFEILSPGTERNDRITKNEEYRQTPSVRRYVMLEQDEPAATIFAREGDRWVGTLLTGDAVSRCRKSGSRSRWRNFTKGWNSPITIARPRRDSPREHTHRAHSIASPTRLNQVYGQVSKALDQTRNG